MAKTPSLADNTQITSLAGESVVHAGMMDNRDYLELLYTRLLHCGAVRFECRSRVPSSGPRGRPKSHPTEARTN